MIGYVADSEYGIPTRYPCGSRMINEVRGKDDYDTLPEKRFFTCKNYQADGLHYRQPWVIGVQEHLESPTKCVEEAEQVIKFVPELNRQKSSRSSKVTRRTSLTISNMLGIRNEIRDSEKHDRLKADLVENVWQKFGNIDE
ncbi:hypothetical protein Bca4012_084949 [Brassica carinata]